MNDAIKLRAWVPDSNRMYQVSGIEFNRNGPKWVRVYGVVPVADPAASRAWYRSVAPNKLSAKRTILVRYTGLKDKNGVEIYEGDIIDLPGYSRRAVIKWGYMSADGEAFGYENIDTEDAVVIGNIYENPELLKVGA